MKRLFILWSMIITITLAGCGVEAETNHTETNGDFTKQDEHLTITTDIETGCKYIILNDRSPHAGSGGITPRMLPNGEHDCG